MAIWSMRVHSLDDLLVAYAPRVTYMLQYIVVVVVVVVIIVVVMGALEAQVAG